MRRRERLIQAGSRVILAFAILPSVTFVGHGPMGAVRGHPQQGQAPSEVSQDGDADGDHAEHCHEGLSKCGTGTQSFVGAGLVGDDADVPDTGDSLHLIPSTDANLYIDALQSRVIRPPRT